MWRSRSRHDHFPSRAICMPLHLLFEELIMTCLLWSLEDNRAPSQTCLTMFSRSPWIKLDLSTLVRHRFTFFIFSAHDLCRHYEPIWLSNRKAGRCRGRGSNEASRHSLAKDLCGLVLPFTTLLSRNFIRTQVSDAFMRNLN